MKPNENVACRRVNDFSLTTRILEITKVKCGDKEAEFWPYIMQVYIQLYLAALSFVIYA